ncbi:MAG: hypothetical protein WAK50_03875 [Nitrososphaeraceae archaeon]
MESVRSQGQYKAQLTAKKKNPIQGQVANFSIQIVQDDIYTSSDKT